MLPSERSERGERVPWSVDQRLASTGAPATGKLLYWLHYIVSVAKHRKRRSGNFVAIPINGELTVGALANQAVVLDDILGGNLTEDLFVMSVDLQGVMIDITAGEGDPSQIGFAHGDYSATEVAENLNVILLGPASKIEQERSRRLVRKTGLLSGDGSNAFVAMTLIGKDGGRLIRTKLKFTVQNGKTINMFLFNNSGAVFTTGARFRWSGTVYGRWIL